MNSIRILFACAIAPTVAFSEEPLSAIDWLSGISSFSDSELSPDADEDRPFRQHFDKPPSTAFSRKMENWNALGLLPASKTGLPVDIWEYSSTESLVTDFNRIRPNGFTPIKWLYYTLLLAEANAPKDANNDSLFLKTRMDVLRRFGAVETAKSLIESAGPGTGELFDYWFDLSLLSSGVDKACDVLEKTPTLSKSYLKRIYCLSRRGDWATAMLIYEACNALDLFNSAEADLLGMFLDSETSGQIPAPEEMSIMTPLLFRLYEAAGNPLPAKSLPLEYAVSDLNGTSGWRAEIEAAEKLTKTGAVTANQLLGLYTERRPSASGSLWDRASAIQQLEIALDSQDKNATGAALVNAWNLLSKHGLADFMSTIYAKEAVKANLPEPARRTVFKMALLSPDFSILGPISASSGRRDQFLIGVINGSPDHNLARSDLEMEIANAFYATGPTEKHERMIAAGRIGQALLSSALLIDNAGPEDVKNIASALQTMLALGFDETAKRVALNLLIQEGPI
ncbi:MAG: hypothetical protein OXC66_00865 [Roseovarius sp.]|nr:hypothetical protein [Roseovarius sp.]